MAEKKVKENSRTLHLIRLAPNMVTIFGLCLGLSAIKAAMNAEWKVAAAYIIIAAVFDGIDGRLARLLNASSNFGAQLDSLADFINFAIAPAFVLYLWVMNDIKGFGWGVALFFSVCGALRLARFNASLEEDKPTWADRFFVGIPAPAGAMLAIAPLGIDFVFKADFPAVYDALWFTVHPIGVCLYAILIASLMASNIPTFSFKKVTILRKHAYLAMMVISLLAICAITAPWRTMIGIGIWYLSTIPVSIYKHYIYTRSVEQ
jgi:CDP-diacylglycerol--serine O-phosphatidyltransferase